MNKHLRSETMVAILFVIAVFCVVLGAIAALAIPADPAWHCPGNLPPCYKDSHMIQRVIVGFAGVVAGLLVFIYALHYDRVSRRDG